MVAKVNGQELDLDITIVKVKFMLKGSRNIQTINCTASQVIEFTDYMNNNKAVIKNKYDRERFENKFYIFTDLIAKKEIVVSIPDVKYWEIPFFMEDENKEYELKMLTIN